MIAEEAAAALIFPDPVTDSSFPWLWYKRGAVNGSEFFRYDIDVKSQRKFRDAGDSLYLIVDNDDPANTTQHIFGIRILYRLP